MGKKLTLGMIFAAFAVIGFYMLTLSFMSGNTSVDEYAKEAALSNIPDKVNAIMGVATLGGGLIVAIIIILIVLFWDKIMDFNLLDLADYFPNSSSNY